MGLGIEGDPRVSRIVPERLVDQQGQGLAEYALILALIAIVAIVALIFFGGQISTILSTVGTSIERFISQPLGIAEPGIHGPRANRREPTSAQPVAAVRISDPRRRAGLRTTPSR
jgi:pilus assembly protein Flp/PilA